MFRKRPKYITTLVIGDAHSCPRHHNDRFIAMGRFIEDRRPTNIVQIGDFITLDSLSSHDLDFPAENLDLSFKDDIHHALDAYKKGLQKAARKTIGSLLWLNGNHEDRGARFAKSIPSLRGTVDEDDILGVSADGWQVVPYKATAFMHGVAFTHIPLAKRSANTVGGDNVTKKAVDMYGTSVIFGHTHRLASHDASSLDKKGQSKRRTAINVGWFGDYCPKYVSAKHTGDWWAGLVMLTHASDGEVDFETIAMSRIKKDYL